MDIKDRSARQGRSLSNYRVARQKNVLRTRKLHDINRQPSQIKQPIPPEVKAPKAKVEIKTIPTPPQAPLPQPIKNTEAIQPPQSPSTNTSKQRPVKIPAPIPPIEVPPLNQTTEDLKSVKVLKPKKPILNMWRMQNMHYAMAAVVFSVGMFVAVQGYRGNEQTEHVVEILQDRTKTTAVLGDTDETEASEAPTAVDVPNEDVVTFANFASHSVDPNQARYLRIPSIGVSSRVLSVGNTPDGAVDTPDGIFDAAIYSNGASISDDRGAAFIVGHVHGPSAPGVFYKLDELNVGDVIEAEQGDGKVHKFKVTSKQRFNIDSVDMREALRSDDSNKLGLNLMTCGGDFNFSEFEYSERVLVKSVRI